jgi:hypothetical protein
MATQKQRVVSHVISLEGRQPEQCETHGTPAPRRQTANHRERDGRTGQSQRVAGSMPYSNGATSVEAHRLTPLNRLITNNFPTQQRSAAIVSQEFLVAVWWQFSPLRESLRRQTTRLEIRHLRTVNPGGRCRWSPGWIDACSHSRRTRQELAFCWIAS